jgi:hypothetical protein
MLEKFVPDGVLERATLISLYAPGRDLNAKNDHQNWIVSAPFARGFVLEIN